MGDGLNFGLDFLERLPFCGECVGFFLDSLRDCGDAGECRVVARFDCIDGAVGGKVHVLIHVRGSVLTRSRYGNGG